MSARTTPGRIAATVTAIATATAAALLGALVAPGPAGAAAEPVVNGGIVTDTNYLSPDGTVRVLPIDQSTTPVRAFSPDGTSVAYVKGPDGPDEPNELWVLEAGDDVSKVADLAQAPVYHLAWSRDGRSIAVASGLYRPQRGDTRSFLHVVDVDAGTATQLVDTTWNRSVRFGGIAWSHEGGEIAVSVSDEYYEADDVVWVSAADGSVSSLTDNCDWSDWEVADDCSYELVTGGYRGLDMHPDGTRLITMDHTGVYTVDTTTGAETVLRDDGRNYNQLQWSPDGTRIAWTAVEDWGDTYKVVVYTDSVAGGERTAVATNVGSAVDWQPCSAASCPSYGPPRHAAKIKLTGADYRRKWIDAEFTIRSVVDRKPATGVSEIPVVLQRRAGGKWRKVFSNTAYEYRGSFETPLRRPASGECRIKVTFPGDFGHEPAKKALGLPRC